MFGSKCAKTPRIGGLEQNLASTTQKIAVSILIRLTDYSLKYMYLCACMMKYVAFLSTLQVSVEIDQYHLVGQFYGSFYGNQTQ